MVNAQSNPPITESKQQFWCNGNLENTNEYFIHHRLLVKIDSYSLLIKLYFRIVILANYV